MLKLNKQICQMCITEWVYERVVNDDWKNSWAKWDDTDEVNWIHGYIKCGGKAGVGHVGLGPQIECRMRLEQILVSESRC